MRRYSLSAGLPSWSSLWIYKNIHIGAIATFYIIALLARLISLHVVNYCCPVKNRNLRNSVASC